MTALLGGSGSKGPWARALRIQKCLCLGLAKNCFEKLVQRRLSRLQNQGPKALGAIVDVDIFAPTDKAVLALA